MSKKKLNKVQQLALSLIQSDAIFINSMLKINFESGNLKSNYICMLFPYLGIFTYESEQWGQKVEIATPVFNSQEKKYYTELRQAHKIFDLSYKEFRVKMNQKLNESDSYFKSNKSLLSKITGSYYNVGIDVFEKKYCGNTVLIGLYIPSYKIGENAEYIRDLSIVMGKLAKSYMQKNNSNIYKYNKNLTTKSIDINFFNSKMFFDNSIDNFCCFSVLCAINFIVYFIENLFEEEIPQKLKYSYLLYFYLCRFVKNINNEIGSNYIIDDTLCNQNFRNCIAHYGLGQVMKDDDIISGDLLGGLTNKIFNMNYYEVKDFIYQELKKLGKQIEENIFLKDVDVND